MSDLIMSDIIMFDFIMSYLNASEIISSDLIISDLIKRHLILGHLIMRNLIMFILFMVILPEAWRVVALYYKRSLRQLLRWPVPPLHTGPAGRSGMAQHNTVGVVCTIFHIW